MDIIAREKDLIGDQLDRVLWFFGYEYLVSKPLPVVHKSGR